MMIIQCKGVVVGQTTDHQTLKIGVSACVFVCAMTTIIDVNQYQSMLPTTTTTKNLKTKKKDHWLIIAVKKSRKEKKFKSKGNW